MGEMANLNEEKNSLSIAYNFLELLNTKQPKQFGLLRIKSKLRLR